MFDSGFRWLGLATLLAGFVLPGCVAATKYQALEKQLASAEDELAYTQDQLGEAESLLQDAYVDEDALAAANARAEAAEKDKAKLASALDEIKGKSALLAQRGVEIVYNEKTGMAGFRGGSDVFFTPGGDSLTKQGKETLDLIAGELMHINGPIRVDGHTDSDPVKKTKDKYPHGNIQLGASRAISVREYLVKKGIPGERIWIASHGPFQPLVEGSTKEAKARNRRVEILVPVGPPSNDNAH